MAEIGFELLPSFQKRGIMSRAVSMVLRFGFEKLSLQKIVATAAENNQNSVRLLLKMGFQMKNSTGQMDASFVEGAIDYFTFLKSTRLLQND